MARELALAINDSECATRLVLMASCDLVTASSNFCA
jgi:hypothetical protein